MDELEALVAGPTQPVLSRLSKVHFSRSRQNRRNDPTSFHHQTSSRCHCISSWELEARIELAAKQTVKQITTINPPQRCAQAHTTRPSTTYASMAAYDKTTEGTTRFLDVADVTKNVNDKARCLQIPCRSRILSGCSAFTFWLTFCRSIS